MFDKEKKIKKTLKKAKATKCTSEKEIKAKLLQYIKNLSHAKLNDMCLPDSYLNDKDFVLKMYNINRSTIHYFPPTDKLNQDMDFVMEYIKLHRLKCSLFDSWFKEIVGKHLKAKTFDHSEFITRLSNKFPEMNLVQVVKDILKKDELYAYGEKLKKIQQENHDILKAEFDSWPTDIMCEQAKRFGRWCLRELPVDINNFNQYVEAGIEKDGFDTLNVIPIDKLVENRDLIVTAYNKEGYHGLNKYLIYTLSPRRSVDGHPYYSNKFEAVQEQLLNDPIIQTILRKEKKKIQKKIETRQHLSLIDDEMIK